VIFPAMLKAEGSFILPKVPAQTRFLNLEGNKLSTSKNWAVWLHEYLEEFQSAGCFTFGIKHQMKRRITILLGKISGEKQ
jgi:uncharacterized protein YutD